MFPDNNPATGAFEIMLEFAISENDPETVFGVELSNAKGEQMLIGYDKANSKFYINREKAGKSDFSADFKGLHTAPFRLSDTLVNMRLLIDVASVELFAMNGEVVMTDIFFPTEDFGTSGYSATTESQC
ncbi:MAG: GH32 C-terminal domain-containing protein [Bacteroidales bacterium]|nr:GH32 C-terminal domain-containing protein [Bacteroidales bacterium]